MSAPCDLTQRAACPLGKKGFVLLLLVIAAFVAPPLYAALAFFTGDWFFGIAALAAWAVLLRFRRPMLHWTLEGIEYASI
jgi:hypothetical protein